MHPTRESRLRDLEDLARSESWEELYQRFALWEFPSEVRMGFQLAFLRPFAVPRMAKVLIAAGAITTDPTRRAYHTGIVIHELIVDGLGGPRARRMIAHMNRAHRVPGITQEDLTYVLCAFIVVPPRYADLIGWRPVTEHEREASLRFYQRLGELMNINQLPGTYSEAENILRIYEAGNLASSDEGARLGHDIVGVLRRRLPRPVRGLARLLFTSQLDDARIARAIGLRPAGRVARGVARLVVALRRPLTARSRPPAAPSFYPGQPAGVIYPRGYTLDDVDRTTR